MVFPAYCRHGGRPGARFDRARCSKTRGSPPRGGTSYAHTRVCSHPGHGGRRCPASGIHAYGRGFRESGVVGDGEAWVSAGKTRGFPTSITLALISHAFPSFSPSFLPSCLRRFHFYNDLAWIPWNENRLGRCTPETVGKHALPKARAHRALEATSAPKA